MLSRNGAMDAVCNAYKSVLKLNKNDFGLIRDMFKVYTPDKRYTMFYYNGTCNPRFWHGTVYVSRYYFNVSCARHVDRWEFSIQPIDYSDLIHYNESKYPTYSYFGEYEAME